MARRRRVLKSNLCAAAPPLVSWLQSTARFAMSSLLAHISDEWSIYILAFCGGFVGASVHLESTAAAAHAATLTDLLVF